MFGAQLGQGLAALAAEVVSASDIGLPLGPAGTAALVVDNLTGFAEGLERPLAEVRLFIALREAAHQRLFQHVPWLRQQLIDAVDAYGRGIMIDPAAISTALSDIDPANPESLQNALTGGLFEPKNTDAQNAALRRLETLLALVEGWVDTVAASASTERMPGSVPLAEAIRRRRASGGPAEQTFATLVGLELRPRRLREAATLWREMSEQHGLAARDGLWSHPDLLPGADDLDDPAGFVNRYGTAAELDMSGFEALTGEAPAEQDQNSGSATPEETPRGEGGRSDGDPPSTSSGEGGDSPAS
jgi:putative hydrolase